MKNLLSFLLLLSLSLTANLAYAQVPEPDSTEIWVIETQAGSLYKGHIVKMESLSVTLKTTEGVTINLSREVINKMYKKGKGDERLHRRYLVNRYHLNSSAYSLGKNQGYYRNNTLLLNEVAFGITDYFDLQLSTTFLFSPVILSGKYSIPLVKNKLTAALRVGMIMSPYFNGQGTFLSGYILGANITIGSRKRSLSLIYSTIGPTVIDKTDGNFLSISGKIDLNPKISLVADVIFYWQPSNTNIDFYDFQRRYYYLNFGSRFRLRKFIFDLTSNFVIRKDVFFQPIIPFPSASVTIPF